MKIHAKDTVLVTAGKDKGKTGKVLRTFPKENTILVEGVNKYVKHIKKQGQKSGERVLRERPLPAASVAIVNPDTGKQDRVGYNVGKDGKKMRIFRKTQKAVEV